MHLFLPAILKANLLCFTHGIGHYLTFVFFSSSFHLIQQFLLLLLAKIICYLDVGRDFFLSLFFTNSYVVFIDPCSIFYIWIVFTLHENIIIITFIGIHRDQLPIKKVFNACNTLYVATSHRETRGRVNEWVSQWVALGQMSISR